MHLEFLELTMHGVRKPISNILTIIQVILMHFSFIPACYDVTFMPL